jgi:hypothetical protein
MKRTLTTLTTLSLLFLQTACTDMPQTANNTPEAPTVLRANSSASFELTQPWRDASEANFRSGQIELSWTAEALIVEATLADDALFTKSDADNQPMWELGDVFEVFLQIEGREDYAEMHITPANTRFHAHKPNVAGTDPAGEWKPIENWLVAPIGFSAEAIEVEGGWQATFEIPPSILALDAFTPGTALRISFARYDGAPDRAPMLSATAPHRIESFHIPEDWHRIVLND